MHIQQQHGNTDDIALSQQLKPRDEQLLTITQQRHVPELVSQSSSPDNMALTMQLLQRENDSLRREIEQQATIAKLKEENLQLRLDKQGRDSATHEPFYKNDSQRQIQHQLNVAVGRHEIRR